MLLESLIVPLTLDKSGFTKGAKAAEGEAGDLAAGLLKIGGKAVIAGVAGVVAAVGAFVAASISAVKATFEWAEELDKIQDVTGATTKEAAAYAFVARKAGISSETFAKSQVLLYKSLLKSNGELDTSGKSLLDYGINIKDANGVLKTNAQLTDEIAKKYATLGTAQERINFLTEIYGRQGAELIDFFDTLAGEGGIDAVTKKVDALGLAIDPARYEQFNRNLEELKLIGLSLAVAFTEKVMPVLEKVIDWLMDVATSPDFMRIKKNFENLISDIINLDWDGIKEEINSMLFGGGSTLLPGNKGGSQQTKTLEDNLKNTIKNIDWNAVGMTIRDGMLIAWKTALNVIDWLQRGAEFNAKLLEAFMTRGGWQRAALYIGKSMTDLIAGIMGMTGEQLVQGFIGTMNFITAEVSNSLTRWKNAILSKGGEFLSAGNDLASKVKKGWTNKIEEIISGVSEFLNRLKAAINSVKLSINIGLNIPSLPAWLKNLLGGGGGVGGSPRPPGSTKRINPGVDARASGGPVIGGQSYKVSEFFQPEIFTPNMSGRVDNLRNISTEAEVTLSRKSIEELAERLGLIIPAATVRAMNNG